MNSVVILDVPEYLVTSYGNGLSYSLLRKSDGAELYLQDAQDVNDLQELLLLTRSKQSTRYTRFSFAEIIDSEYGDQLDASLLQDVDVNAPNYKKGPLPLKV